MSQCRKVCAYCKKIYFVTPAGEAASKFCSYECYWNCMNGSQRKERLKKSCPVCGKEFEYLEKKKKKKYCSRECAFKGGSEARKVERIKKTCPTCGKEFECTRARETIHCCDKCAREARKKSDEQKFYNCDMCGKPIQMDVPTYNRLMRDLESGKRNSKCCSKKCSTQYSIKGSYITCAICGKKFYRSRSYQNRVEFACCSYKCKGKFIMENEKYHEEYRNRTLKMLSDGTISCVNSKPQQLVDALLDSMNIKYTREYISGPFSFDNYLHEYGLFIEVQGNYWHCNPNKYQTSISDMQLCRITRDKAKHTYALNKRGVQILYLWEYDILNFPELCKALIQYYISNQGAIPNYNSFNYSLVDGVISLSEDIVYPYQEMDISQYRHLIQKASA